MKLPEKISFSSSIAPLLLRSLIALLLLGSTIAACAPSSIAAPAAPAANPSANPAPNPDTPAPAPITGEGNSSAATQPAGMTPTSEPDDFTTTYGISIETAYLCTDGVNTTLVLRTTLDLAAWRLGDTYFFPKGKAYFETAILFLENGKMFSNVSSGKRDPPIFNPQNNTLTTAQIFIFPKAPQPNAQFMVKAKVSLVELPPGYRPPVPMDFLEPGFIEVPMEYLVPATLGRCP